MDHAHGADVVDRDDQVPVGRLVLEERLDDVDARDAGDDVDGAARLLAHRIDERVDRVGLRQIERNELRLAAGGADLRHRGLPGRDVYVTAVDRRPGAARTARA